MYKTDDEVVKEEKEYNGDEPISMVKHKLNEEDKNELLKCEISIQQQQLRPQLMHIKKKLSCLLYISGKWHCVV